MARSFNPKFAKPSVLGSIDPSLLCQLLEPHREWLGQSDINLDDPAALNLDALSLLIMTGTGLPDELVELVCLIDDLATDQMFDRVLSCAQRMGVRVEDDITGHDLAVRVMLVDPEALIDLRTERTSLRPQKYERYMAVTEKIPRPRKRTRERIQALERDLDEDFINRFRQRSVGVARVYDFDEPHGFRLMIRRGDTRRNQLVIDDDDETRTKPLIHRPELYDVVRFDERYGDLLINAKAKADIRAYCLMVGKHLFDDRWVFDPTLAPRRYTLDPIRDNGPACLSCAHIDGLEEVRLTLLRMEPPGYDCTPFTIGPGNVFEALSLIGGVLDSSAELTRAVLRFRLRGQRRERAVTITPPITAKYERDDAAEPIEQFIEQAGFLLPREESLRGAPETLFSLY